jgi:hypothetical protein
MNSAAAGNRSYEMTKSALKCLVWFAVLCAGVRVAAAHHSVTMYALNKQIVVEGTITTMRWSNPHVMIDFISKAGAEQPARHWTIEASSPGVLTRSGWNKRSLVAGDRVQVQLAPLRDGTPGGLMRKITKLDTGEVLEWTFADGEKPESN